MNSNLPLQETAGVQPRFNLLTPKFIGVPPCLEFSLFADLGIQNPVPLNPPGPPPLHLVSPDRPSRVRRRTSTAAGTHLHPPRFPAPKNPTDPHLQDAASSPPPALLSASALHRLPRVRVCFLGSRGTAPRRQGVARCWRGWRDTRRGGGGEGAAAASSGAARRVRGAVLLLFRLVDLPHAPIQVRFCCFRRLLSGEREMTVLH